MARGILIIDDNPAFRTMARSLLARDGLIVVAEAGTGSDGVQQAKRHRPGLVLVDVQLPDFDGFEVAERLSRFEAPPDVILTSSLDAADFGALVASSPALGFIAKADLSAAAIEELVARSV
jgi:CheY-like chemotaxis protein